MNYQKLYNNLIETRKCLNRKKIRGLEAHHIIMKSIGGSDDSDNIVLLTSKEHLFAHRLLWKIYKEQDTRLGCKASDETRLLMSKNISLAAQNRFDKNGEKMYLKWLEMHGEKDAIQLKRRREEKHRRYLKNKEIK